MKTCNNCGSRTFDDMETCYDCMNSYSQPVNQLSPEREQTAARLQVVLAGYFSYELLLNKLDGRSLSVGSATENSIVIPQEQVAQRQLEVFYAHGQIWAESVGTSLQAIVGETPLCGTVSVKPGTEITVGDATITVLEV